MHRLLRVEVPANGARSPLPASFMAGLDGPRGRQHSLGPSAMPGPLRLRARHPAGDLAELVLDHARDYRRCSVAGRAARLWPQKPRNARMVLFHTWIPDGAAGRLD